MHTENSMDAYKSKQDETVEGYLCLSLRPGETVEIAKGVIEVTYYKRDGNKIQIAIKAPKDIPIVRQNAIKSRSS